VRALALVAIGVLAGCGGASKDAKDPNVVAVSKASGAHPGGTPPKPCDATQGAVLDAEHAEGVRVVELCLKGASAQTQAEVLKTLSLAPGKTLGAEALRRDLASAYKTGLVDQIEVTARSSGGGAVLFFDLHERPRIEGVSFDGVASVAGDPILESFPKPGARLDGAKLRMLEQKLTEAYATRGFDEASVKHEVAAGVDGGVKVKIVVVEGTRAKVGKVTFEGAHGGREVGLRKAVDLEEGAPLIVEKVERAGLLVNTFYYDRGYMLVKIDTPKRTRAADGTTAIAFTITEGPIFKIGKISFAKVDAATEKDLLANMKTKPGEVFNRAKLKADLEAIETRARQRGKTVNVEPRTNIDAKKGIVDLVLDVSERS
jgi:outer membrane protein insertion porin family